MISSSHSNQNTAKKNYKSILEVKVYNIEIYEYIWYFNIGTHLTE